jgi:PBP1b-binding outer membrane lipoprotein LpoB
MRYTLIIAALLLAACSNEPAEEDQQSVLYDAAKTPIDKAESVEATLLESAETRDKAIEDAED